MRKLVLAVAVFTTMGSFALVQAVPETNKTPLVAEVVENDYKEVSMSSLNERVQTTIKSYEASYDVEKIERSATKSMTRVTLKEKNSTMKKVVILNDEGNEVK